MRLVYKHRGGGELYVTHIPTSRHLSDSQHICSQKRHTDLLQVANLTGLSTSCNKSAKIRLVATWHLLI